MFSSRQSGHASNVNLTKSVSLKTASEIVKNCHPGFLVSTKTIFSNFRMLNELAFRIICLLGFYPSRCGGGEGGDDDGVGAEDGESSVQRHLACKADFLLSYQRQVSRIPSHDHFSSFLAFDPLFLTFNPGWPPQPLFFCSPQWRNLSRAPLSIPLVSRFLFDRVEQRQENGGGAVRQT